MNGTSFQSDIKYWLKQGNTVNHLLFWNILVFVVVGLVNLLAFVSRGGIFAVASAFLYNQLALHSAYPVLLRQPWGLITYMFTHVGFFHLLFNMINLYWFGNLFRSFLGNQRVLPLYILGSLAGGVAFILAFNYLPAFSNIDGLLIGASASIMCLLVACATLTPNYEIGLLIIGMVRLKWLALAIVIIDILSITYGNPGGMIAHLGGSLFGFLYIKLLQSGRDMTTPLVFLFDKLSSRPRITVKPRPRRSGNFKPKKSPLRVVKKDENPQSRVDELLDKINERGYQSLSADEKAFLEKVSKE